jgi:hypothetical protein
VVAHRSGLTTQTVGAVVMASRRSKDGRAISLPVGFPKRHIYHDEFYLTDDEWAAHCFLMGYEQFFTGKGEPIDDLDTYYGVDKRSRPAGIYELMRRRPSFIGQTWLSREYEAFGREALLRVLKSKEPLSDVLRDDLALLFDQTYEFSRKVVFKFPSRSSSRSWNNKDFFIGVFIEEKMLAGKKWEDAVKAAQDNFWTNGRPALRSTIAKSWQVYVKELWGHPRPTRSRSRRT